MQNFAHNEFPSFLRKACPELVFRRWMPACRLPAGRQGRQGRQVCPSAEETILKIDPHPCNCVAVLPLFLKKKREEPPLIVRLL